MNKKLRYSLLMLLLAVFSGAWAQKVTYDFTGSDWSVSNGELTNGQVSFTGEGSANFKMNTGYFMLGKKDAYIDFPEFNFDVEKIVVVGRSGASGFTKLNIYVDDEPVSQETTGCTGTNTYIINEDYREAGTIYTLKVNSDHNAQITKIMVYEVNNATPVATINGLSPLELNVGDEDAFELDADFETEDYSIAYESNKTNVLTVDDEGNYEAKAAGTATVTVTITPENTDIYKAVSEQFNVIVHAPTLANIAALTAQTSAGSYDVTLNNAVVTYTNGKYAYIQDESGAVVFYKNGGTGLTAGQVLNGTATVTYQLYNNNPQITALTGVTPEAGTTTPEPTVVAADEFPVISEVLSQWFTVPEVTITEDGGKYYMDLNGQNVQLYGQGAAQSFTLSDLSVKYSVTGFPTLYNTTLELQIFEVPVAVGALPDLVNNVTLTPMEITVGDSDAFDVSYVMDKNASNDPVITYASSDETILSVTEAGEYEALAEGTVSVTVTLTPGEDDAEAFNEVTAAFEVTVKAAIIPGTDKYELVTDVSSLAVNDEIIIVATTDGETFYAMGEQSGNNRIAVNVPVEEDDTIIPNSEIQILTIEEGDLGFAFNTGNGYLYAASSSSNHLKTESVADANAYATVSINSETGNATIVFQGSYTRNNMRFNPNNGKPIFSCYAETSSIQTLPRIYRKIADLPETVTVTVGERGAVSFSSTYPLDFADADVQAYIVTEKNGSYFNKIEVTQVPANTGIVVEGAPGEYQVPIAETTPEDLEDNLLVATSTGAYTVEEADYGRAYGLFYSTTKKAVGFKKMSLGKTIDVNKCYILLPEASGAEEIFFTIDGIDNIEQTAPVFEGTAYNLNGQKVNASYKGVIIVNGKKVINK